MTTVNDLKTVFNSGMIMSENGHILTFDEMVLEFNNSRTIFLHTDNGVYQLYVPLPKWMKIGALVGVPTLMYLTDNALRVAGY